jgi:FixJ family two-component response regulator
VCSKVGRGRILPIDVGIIDDDVSVRKGVTRLLRSEGLSSTSFSSAEEFLASGNLESCRCLIVDIQLGGMSGLELMQHLRHLGHSSPIVFVTAHDESVIQGALDAAGPVVCLRKPFEAKSLLDWVWQAIERQSGQN